MFKRSGWKILLLGALCAWLAFAAGADGQWTGEIRLTVPRVQTRTFTLDLKADASGRVSGTIAGENGQVEILDGRIDRGEISFGVPTGASDLPRFEFRGSFANDTATFTISGVDPTTGALIQLGEATAKRAR